MEGKEEDREQSSHQVDRQESRKAGGETLAKGWRPVWGTGRRSGSGWEYHLGNAERKILGRPLNRGHQPWRQEATTSKEGERSESEGGDTGWLGHFCPQGSAFLEGWLTL